MDILTHSLLAVALSRALFQRRVPNATLLLLLAANLPDIDVLSLAGGRLAYLEIHRGYTHALVVLPFLAAIAVGLTRLFAASKLPLLPAWLIASIGVASHLLLDWTGSYGLRFLLPFSSKWFYLDLNGAYDGILILALVSAFLLPWFVNLVAGEIGGRSRHRGQGSAIAVLLFLCFYEGARWTLHQRALNQLNSRLYEDEVPFEVSALPLPNDPLHWTGIVETSDAFRMLKIGVLDIDDAADARIFLKPPKIPAYLSALKYEPFRYLIYFSRFPVWTFEPVPFPAGLGQKVELTDLRFGPRFAAIALADQNGKILETKFSGTTIF